MTLGSLPLYIHLVDCPKCLGRIVLPRRSLLGEYEGEVYQPTGAWPLTIVCTRTGQMSGVGADAIRLEIEEAKDLLSPEVVLWQIEARCDREGCGCRTTRYACASANEEAERVM